jgi:hypothetical protein
MGSQTRSVNTYQKINTLFKRDKYNIIMPYDGYVDEVFEVLKDIKWDSEEKIDGTSTRIEVSSTIIYDDSKAMQGIIAPIGVTFSLEYKGKTDNAQIPPMLLSHLKANYPKEVVFEALGIKENVPVEEWEEHKWGTTNEKTGVFTPDPDKIPKLYTIYGEGYGPKIQAGGNYIKEGNSFIGFDVKVNDLYLLRPNRDEILKKMHCPIVPFIGQFTIEEAIEYVKKGFVSKIAVANPNYLAEGLVLRTSCGLKDRRGNRIIVKIKTCDWNKYYAKYGTYDKVDQEPNEHY